MATVILSIANRNKLLHSVNHKGDLAVRFFASLVVHAPLSRVSSSARTYTRIIQLTELILCFPWRF
eukprot:COSAG02_NODE_31487_length_532_cov_11.933025_2_plen_65_part_01